MLTVLLATRNRSQILRDVLESYCHLQPPPFGWKLVVVDNGSTDQTALVVASFVGRLPVQYVFEAKLGKNFGLNAGLELVEGDLVVFTDDDAFPVRDWLLQWRQAADAQPAYSMFGGAVLPRWEVQPPSWVQWVELAPAYSVTDPTLKEGPIEPHHIFGPSMAIRSDLLTAGASFDPSIGPRGSTYPMGSETELVLRLGKQGHQAWYVPGAVVEHLIRREQLKKEWVLERAIKFGRGQYRLYCADELSTRRLWVGIPRHLFRDLPKEGILIAASWISFREEARFRSHWRFNFLRGYAMEARQLARSHGKQSQARQALIEAEEATRRR